MHVSATYNIVDLVNQQLGKKLDIWTGRGDCMNLSVAEKSETLVVLITQRLPKRADNPLSDMAEALEIGFRKNPGCVISVILDPELLHVNNWPCTPFNLHEAP